MFAWTAHLKGGPKGLHATVTVGHKVYCIGGISDSDDSDEIEVHVFNTVSLHWVKLPPATEEERPLEVPPKWLHSHTAVLIGHVIYVWGGVADRVHSNVLYTFDVYTHRWFKPEVSGIVPEERRGHSACVLGKVMYIYGGINGIRPVRRSNDMLKLDTRTMVWSSIDTGGTQPRAPPSFHSATIIGEKMFVFDVNSVRVFDTTTNRWLSTPSPQRLPERLWRHCAFTYNEELHILGGEYEFSKYERQYRTFKHLWRLNPKTLSWKKVELKGKVLSPCPSANSACSCCVVGDQVVISGGYAFDAPAWVESMPTPSDNVYILDLSVSLTTLCKLAVVENSLETSGLPPRIRAELASMNNDGSEIHKWPMTMLQPGHLH